MLDDMFLFSLAQVYGIPILAGWAYIALCISSRTNSNLEKYLIIGFGIFPVFSTIIALFIGRNNAIGHFFDVFFLVYLFIVLGIKIEAFNEIASKVVVVILTSLSISALLKLLV